MKRVSVVAIVSFLSYDEFVLFQQCFTLNEFRTTETEPVPAILKLLPQS